MKGINLNNKNGMWKGESVGYGALHDWVKSKFPKPKSCQCCNKKPPRDLANKGIYDRNLKNWEWLCRKCHMTKDGRLKSWEETKIGRKHTKEWKARLSEKMKGNKFRLGIKHSKAIKIKIGLGLKKYNNIKKHEPKTSQENEEAV